MNLLFHEVNTLTNSQQDDKNALVETLNQEGLVKNNSNSVSIIYSSARLSLLGLISTGGLISFYYYHNDLVVTGISTGISALTLLPLPSIIKGTFDFFRNKKSVEAEKDKKLLGMTIKEEVKTQQSTFSDDLREVLSISRTVQNSFETIRQEIEGVKLEIVGVENRLEAKFNAIDARFNQVDGQLVDMQRQINSGFGETHNDLRLVNQRVDELSKSINDQIATIRQRNNPQE
jgi:flagellar capping protein FliD